MAKRKPLTLQNVKDSIKGIKEKSKTDYESAYSDEIDLYKNVLRSISKGDYLVLQEVEELAKEVLKVSNLKFKRETA